MAHLIIRATQEAQSIRNNLFLSSIGATVWSKKKSGGRVLAQAGCAMSHPRHGEHKASRTRREPGKYELKQRVNLKAARFLLLPSPRLPGGGLSHSILRRKQTDKQKTKKIRAGDPICPHQGARAILCLPVPPGAALFPIGRCQEHKRGAMEGCITDAANGSPVSKDTDERNRNESKGDL